MLFSSKAMAKSIYPKARSKDLVVQEMLDEVLIYDLIANEAHCLNKTAAFVWSRCSGDASIADIARSIEKEFGHPVDDNFVRLALSQLSDKNLVVDGDLASTPLPSRRELIKKIGLATAIALPFVASLVAPKNAFASISSCVCTSPVRCARPECGSATFCSVNGICVP